MLASVSNLGRLFGTNASGENATVADDPSSANRDHYDSIIEENVTYDLLYPDIRNLNDAPQLYTCDIDQARHGFAAGKISAHSVGQCPDTRNDILNLRWDRDVRVLVGQQSSEATRVLYDSDTSSSFVPQGSQSLEDIAPAEDRAQAKAMNEERRVVDSHHVGLGGSSAIRRARTTPHSRQNSVDPKTAPSSAADTRWVHTTESMSHGSSLTGQHRQKGPIYSRSVGTGRETSHGRIIREAKEEVDELIHCMFGTPGFLTTASTKVHVKSSKHAYQPKSGSTSKASDQPSRPQTPTSPTRATSQRKSFLSWSTTTEAAQPKHHLSTSTANAATARRLNENYVLITRLFSMDRKSVFKGPFDHFQRLQERETREDRDSIPSHAKAHTVSVPDSKKAHQIKTPSFAIGLVVYLGPRRDENVQSNRRDYPDRQREMWPYANREPVGNAQRRPDLRLDHILGQWSMIMNALTDLEIVTHCKIMELLVSTYNCSSHQTSQTLSVATSALQQVPKFQAIINGGRKRIAAALQIRQVLTGQNRWTLWRSVAQNLQLKASAYERIHFMPALLTAFFALYRVWLNRVNMAAYIHEGESLTEKIPPDTQVAKVRTVIISKDKMSARRLVFLLASFLPPNYAESQTLTAYHGHMDARSRTSVPVPQKQSRPKESPLPHSPNGCHLLRLQSQDKNPTQRHQNFKIQTDRRPSDASSIRSLAIPMARSSSTSKFASTNTMPAIQPQQAVPSFTSFSPDMLLGTSVDRPSSSGSLAALRLQRTLSRTGSNDMSNPSSTDSYKKPEQWGSVRSGFWSTRRASSTAGSDTLGSSGEGLGTQGAAQTYGSHGPKAGVPHRPTVHTGSLSPNRPSMISSQDRHFITGSAKSVLRETEIPLNLSIDEKDGVIDVDYASFHKSTSNTRLSSTQSSGLSFFGVEKASISVSSTGPIDSQTRPNTDSTISGKPSPNAYRPDIKVAGYLQTFHPDFILQAVQPSTQLIQEIKQAMRAEQSQPPSTLSDKGDFSIASRTLLIDLSDYSSKLITLSRQDASSSYHVADALNGDKVASDKDDSIYSKEHFTELTIQNTSCEALIENAFTQTLQQTSHNSTPIASLAVHNESPGIPTPKPAVNMPRTASDKTTLAVNALQSDDLGLKGRLHNQTQRIMYSALENVVKEVSHGMTKSTIDSNDQCLEKAGERSTIRPVTASSADVQQDIDRYSANDGQNAVNLLRSEVRNWLQQRRST